MKTKWLFSVTICLATFQLGATSPLAAREKDLLPEDVSVDEQLPNEGLKIEQILNEDSKIEEVIMSSITLRVYQKMLLQIMLFLSK
jgi:hypothetical protein